MIAFFQIWILPAVNPDIAKNCDYLSEFVEDHETFLGAKQPYSTGGGRFFFGAFYDVFLGYLLTETSYGYDFLFFV